VESKTFCYTIGTVKNDVRKNSERYESLEAFGSNRKADKPSVDRLTTCSRVILHK